MKLTHLFLLAFSALLLGYFSYGYSLTGNVVSTSFHDYISFTAQPDSGRPFGSGALTLDLPAAVRSCTFSGSWETDNDQFNRRNFCHEAKGTFNGYADATGQYVKNDADLFYWAGLSQAKINPPAQLYADYSFWMELCDDTYYATSHEPRYGVTGMFTGFGTSALTLQWDYFDDSNARPYVTFMVDLTCEIASS